MNEKMAGSAPMISIVTRTRNRNIFLPRAFEHIKAAMTGPTEWIIVNDGEPNRELDEFVAHAKASSSLSIKLVCSRQAGRSGAANRGLAEISGEFMHLHDDDDTIKSDFYRKTTGFLRKHPVFGAVCCHVERVEESIENARFKTISTTPHNPELYAVSFASLASAFLIPPISFVARTSCLEKVGEFDTSIDIGEDYDFTLRFLRQFDIGVIREVLCAVHQRCEGDLQVGDWANSEARTDFRTYDALLRNRYFRQDLDKGEFGLGWLLVLGEMNSASRRINILLDMARGNKSMAWLAKKLRRGL